ncbi:MAG: hypothetical protein DMG21_18625 [Acidobacteria bacterium]|nr:MAG: hypothetical protein DMG21_18625 [Acidobacteriota bacterium]
MRFRILGILLCGLTAVPAVAQAPKPAPSPPDETLTYDVTWSIFDAGKVTATLQGSGSTPGDDVHARAVARSQGFASLLFNVEDQFDSAFTSGAVCSHHITKKINEGARHRDFEVAFDSARRVAVLTEHDLNKPEAPPKHAESAIPACVEDVVSAFYYLRRQPLQLGQTFHVPVNDGGKTYDISVEVQAREPVQTGLGTLPAFRLEPSVFGEFYKRKGRMWVWISDDEHHYPLKVKMAISIGAITATLKSAAESPAK